MIACARMLVSGCVAGGAFPHILPAGDRDTAMVNLRLIGDADVPEGPQSLLGDGGRAEAPHHFDWAGDL